MENLKQIQQNKIIAIKEIAITPTIAGNKLNDLFESVDNFRKQEIAVILSNSGYDFDFPITESHIASLMMQSFMLGKEEQQQIHYNGLDN